MNDKHTEFMLRAGRNTRATIARIWKECGCKGESPIPKIKVMRVRTMK